MIALLSGTVEEVGPTSAVVSARGVGFRISCPAATLSQLETGKNCTLHTSLVLREDSATLFGFGTSGERDCFELVQSASGIGPRTALGVVSVLSVAEFVSAVRSENLAVLTRVPGIGRKGAQKLVLELKEKVLQLKVDTSAASETGDDWRTQVAAGLVGLGWTSRDAEQACEDVAHLRDERPATTVAELMRAALQRLARA